MIFFIIVLDNDSENEVEPARKAYPSKHHDKAITSTS